MSLSKNSVLIILSFFSIYVIWGSTYLLNKIVVTEVSPLLLASIRFLSAGILIVIIARFLKLSLKVTKKQILNSVIAGFLFLVYGNGVFVWALKYVDSGFAALIAATQPLFVIFLMRILHGNKIQFKSMIGVVLGIIGMYLLVSQDELILTKDSIIGIIMIFSCVLSWSYASIYVSKADLPSSFLTSSSIILQPPHSRLQPSGCRHSCHGKSLQPAHQHGRAFWSHRALQHRRRHGQGLPPSPE